MAHFAEIDPFGNVLRVIVVDNINAPDPAPYNSEPIGLDYIASIGIPGTFVQTSYSGSFRKQYCGPSFRYDADADVFIAPQPFPSWTLDANHDWQAPTPRPTEGMWTWEGSSLSWVEVI